MDICNSRNYKNNKASVSNITRVLGLYDMYKPVVPEMVRVQRLESVLPQIAPFVRGETVTYAKHSCKQLFRAPLSAGKWMQITAGIAAFATCGGGMNMALAANFNKEIVLNDVIYFGKDHQGVTLTLGSGYHAEAKASTWKIYTLTGTTANIWAHTNWGLTKINENSVGSNAYQGSVAQSAANAIYDNRSTQFTNKETEMLLETTIDKINGTNGSGSPTDTTTAYFYVPSMAQLLTAMPDTSVPIDGVHINPERALEGGGYWLRDGSNYIDWNDSSPSEHHDGLFVLSNGTVKNEYGPFSEQTDNSVTSLSSDYLLRPVTNIDVSSVLFTSYSKAENGIFTVDDSTGTAKKLTLKDYYDASTNPEGQRKLTLTKLQLDGMKFSLEYEGAKTGTGEGVSAILADATGDYVAYGRMDSSGSASSTATGDLSGMAAGSSYTAHVYNELAQNVSNGSDLAGEFTDVKVNTSATGKAGITLTGAELATYSALGIVYDLSETEHNVFTLTDAVPAETSIELEGLKIKDGTAKRINQLTLIEGSASDLANLNISNCGTYSVKATDAEGVSHTYTFTQNSGNRGILDVKATGFLSLAQVIKNTVPDEITPANITDDGAAETEYDLGGGVYKIGEDLGTFSRAGVHNGVGTATGGARTLTIYNGILSGTGHQKPTEDQTTVHGGVTIKDGDTIVLKQVAEVRDFPADGYFATVEQGGTLQLSDCTLTLQNAITGDGTLTVDADSTLNVTNTSSTVKSFEGKGLISADGSYVSVADTANAAGSKFWAKANGGVVQLGDGWTTAELSNLLQNAGLTTTAHKDGFSVNDGTAVMAITKHHTMNSDGALLAGSGSHTNITTGVHFGDDSLIVVPAVLAATAEGAISGIITPPDVGTSSKLILDGEINEDNTYIIFSGSGVDPKGEYWSLGNIFADTELVPEYAITLTDAFGIKFAEANDSSIIPDVVKEMKKDTDDGSGGGSGGGGGTGGKGAGKKFIDTVKEKSGGTKTDAYKEGVNAMANIGELGNSVHGSVTAAGLISDAVQHHNSLTNAGLTKINLAANGEDGEYGAATDNGSGGFGMLSDEERYETKDYIWADYIRSKESVYGLSLGGIGTNNSTDYNGAIVGIDLGEKGSWDMGVAIACIDGTTKGYNTGVSTSSDADYYGVTLYGRKNITGGMRMAANLLYLSAKNDVSQYNNGTDVTAEPKNQVFSLDLRCEKSYDCSKGSLIPYVGARASYVATKEYGNNLGVRYNVDKQMICSIPMGIQFTRQYYDTYSKTAFYPVVEIGYLWNFGKRTFNQTVNFNGAGNSFDFAGTDSHSYFAKAGFKALAGNGTYGIEYQYNKGDTTRNRKLSITGQWTF